MAIDIEILSEESPYDMAEQWYEVASADHFWFQWRFHTLCRLLAGHELGTEILEIGCGNGVAREQFEQHFDTVVHGCDLNRAAMELARPGRGRFFYYNVHDRKPEWRERFSTILLLDVIEHIDDTVGFLQSVAYHLRPEGQIVINVPALQAAYSRYDRTAGHKKRYSASLLARELKSANLKLKRHLYWGLLMIPVLFMRKISLFCTPEERIMARGLQPSKTADIVLRTLMHLERRCISRVPIGSSLAALALKSD